MRCGSWQSGCVRNVGWLTACGGVAGILNRWPPEQECELLEWLSRLTSTWLSDNCARLDCRQNVASRELSCRTSGADCRCEVGAGLRKETAPASVETLSDMARPAFRNLNKAVSVPIRSHMNKCVRMWIARFAAGCRSDNAKCRQCTNCKSPGGDSGVTSGQVPERHRRAIERTVASSALAMMASHSRPIAAICRSCRCRNTGGANCTHGQRLVCFVDYGQTGAWLSMKKRPGFSGRFQWCN